MQFQTSHDSYLEEIRLNNITNFNCLKGAQATQQKKMSKLGFELGTWVQRTEVLTSQPLGRIFFTLLTLGRSSLKQLKFKFFLALCHLFHLNKYYVIMFNRLKKVNTPY